MLEYYKYQEVGGFIACSETGANVNRKKSSTDSWSYLVDYTEEKQRKLLSVGFKGCVSIKNLLLKKKNELKRLQWAEQFKDWILEDWKNLLLTDESNFELFVSKRSVIVKRTPEWKSENYIVPTVKHDSGVVIIWECFRAEIAGDIV